MNDCGRMDELLNDFVDGELSAAAARDVAAHVEICAACRNTVGALRSLRADAAALPGSLEPGRDLWPEIGETIEAGRAGLLPFVPSLRAATRGPTRFRGWTAGLAAAAAVVLVAATASITMVLMRGGAGSPEPRNVIAPAGQAVLASFRQAEIDYQRATDDLRAMLEQRRGELAPETVALLEENLRVIDAAINQIWTALENDPGRAGNRHLFNSLYQKKVMLLQQAVRLPSQS